MHLKTRGHVQLCHFLDSDMSDWAAAFLAFLPQGELGLRNLQFAEVLPSEAHLKSYAYDRPTIKTQQAALHALLHCGAVGGCLLEEYLRNLLSIPWDLARQLEVMPPSAHAALCALHMTPLADGSHHLELDVSRALVQRAAALLTELPCLDSLKLTHNAGWWCASFQENIYWRLAFVNRLTALKKLTLHLQSCRCDHVLGHLTGLSKLQHLSLRDCHYVADHLKYLAGLKAMQRLDLTGCGWITDKSLKHLGGLVAMQHLSLCGCLEVTDRGLKHLVALTALKHLDLVHSYEVTDDSLEHLSGLVALQHLNLSHCRKLEGHGLKHLNGLTSLQHLDLSHCHGLTGPCLIHLSGLVFLQHLDLSGSPHSTDLGVEQISSLKSLKTVQPHNLFAREACGSPQNRASETFGSPDTPKSCLC
jgi:Leucine-rich repeat (LRR) protein